MPFSALLQGMGSKWDSMGLRFQRIGLALSAMTVLTGSAWAQNYVIRGAKIVIKPGEILEGASIAVSMGKITAIGNVEPTSDATVLDGAGLTVYPGFIDAYRTGLVKLPDAPAAATAPDATVTAPATMWAQNRKGNRAEVMAHANLDSSGFARALSSGVVVSHAAVGGAVFRGWTTLTLSAEKAVLTDRVGMEMSFRGGSGQGYPSSLMGTIALLRQTLIDAKDYTEPTAPADPKEKPKGDAVLASLKPAAVGADPVVFYANSELEIRRAFRLQDEFRLKLMIAGGKEAYKVVDELKKRNIPVLVDIKPDSEPSTNPTQDGPPKEVLEERKSRVVERNQNLKQLIASGVRVAFGSFSSTPSEWLTSMREQIKLGLTHEQIVAGVTTSPAEIFGLGGFGVIEKGASANLTIVESDLASEKAKVKWVFVDGKFVDPNAKPAEKPAETKKPGLNTEVAR
jgi:imidazolonepropionase-like amidohydrolase